MSWKSYETAAERGPMSLFWKILAPILMIVVVVGGLGIVFGWFGEAAQVAREQFGPRAALQKYEWFIEQSERIAKMDADIALFRSRAHAVPEDYKAYGEDRSKWPLHAQAEYGRLRQQTRDDLLAVISQRNNLVKEYTAQLSKWNWSMFDTTRDKAPLPTYSEVTLE